ncbi:MAG TPA: hypothetical protein VET69_04540, partial [Terriglobales bacterium]|nr:hypothetical protein [Terriglobales bacterium]
MRSVLPIVFLVLLPMAAVAQWHGAPARSAPVRAPMAMRAAPLARLFMARPMPARGGFHFRPAAPGRMTRLR